MKHPRRCTKGYRLRQTNACLLIFCLLLNVSVSVALAKPKEGFKRFGHGNPHANPHSNPHGGGALSPVKGGFNPASIMVGSGGGQAGCPGPSASQGGTLGASSSTVASLGGYVAASGRNKAFISRPGSCVVIKLNPHQGHAFGNTAKFKAGYGKGTALASGDVFSKSISGLGCALVSDDGKRPSCQHRGQQWQGVDFNPGGGPLKDGKAGIGEKGWGTGNKGNGVGNTWVGNQGRGVGGGMAGGCKSNGGGGNGGGGNGGGGDNGDDISTEAAPLPTVRAPSLEEVEFGPGGCPALIEWLAKELGIEGDIQVYIANTFALSTDIQPCEFCARLKEAAMILAETERIAALTLVVNEFAVASVPPSEEQMALIAAALADSDAGTHYASAGEWIDALVEYVGILTAMGYSEGDAVAIVSKYIEPAAETGNAALTAYVEACLADITLSGGKIGHLELPEPHESAETHGLQQFGEKVNAKHISADVPATQASSMGSYIFGGLGVLGVAASILLGLVISRRNR